MDETGTGLLNTPHSTSVAIVVPLLNEAATLRELYSRLVAVADAHQLQLEVIFVDDGSTDLSWPTIEELAGRDPRVRGLRLRRNFGKAAALAAGIEHATSPILVTMDADLQDDPQEVPRLIAKLAEGFDCVSGWKKKRHDPWHKTWPSKGFNWLVNRLTGLQLHDHNCGLKAYRRSIFDEVKLYGEMHRFIPALAAAKGFRVTELPVVHHPRQHGQSKYGWSRLPKGFLDLLTVCFLTEYRQRPLHLLGSLGLLSFATGSLLLSWLTASWIITRCSNSLPDLHLHDRALFYYAIVALVVGVQLISMGILAELIIAAHRPMTSPYSISARTSTADLLECSPTPANHAASQPEQQDG
jgi:glycosyltransferase involved in cell wall biosynthesis